MVYEGSPRKDEGSFQSSQTELERALWKANALKHQQDLDDGFLD